MTRGNAGRNVKSATLDHLVERMPAIARVRAHLPGPAAGLPRLCPFRADQHMWTIDLIDGAVTRALVGDAFRLAADAHLEGLSLAALGGMHAWNLEQVRNVLGVVDLVEKLFLVRVHVHACDEDVFRADGHVQLLPRGVRCNDRVTPIASTDYAGA